MHVPSPASPQNLFHLIHGRCPLDLHNANKTFLKLRYVNHFPKNFFLYLIIFLNLSWIFPAQKIKLFTTRYKLILHS